MKKTRILLSFIVIAVVIGGTFLATRAYFRATGTAANNKIEAGTLDMQVGGAQGSAIEPFVVDNIGQEGDVTGSKTWTVNNIGTLPGRLYFRIQDVVNADNGCPQPETLVDTTCGDPGAGEGELGGVLDFKVYLDDQLIVTTDLASANQDVIKATWNGLPEVIIPAGQSKTIKVEYAAGENDYGNEVQSDSVSFNSRFDLVQQTNAKPTP